jgi:hypothetical protein
MKTIPLTIFLVLGPLMAAISLVRGGGLPQAPTVEAQPLLLQTERLVEALASVGAPIDSGRLERLQALQQETDDAVITRGVQAELDALSIAAIVVAADGSISARPRGEPVILDENGWRTVLVKVINGGGLTGQLKLESPHARPIPHGPASEVDDRWMGLSVFSGRPLAPSLSGLGLEYRLIQVYGSRPGSLSGRLELSISDAAGGGSPVLKKWRFDRDADGWGAPHACSLAVRDGSLWISQTGEDPYFSSSVSGRGGRLRLRWQGVSDEDGVAQVFWWTRDDPAPNGSRSVGTPITAGRDGVNEVEFQVEGELAGLRIDPNVGPGRTRIDWIDLERVSGDQAVWAPVMLAWEVRPSSEVTFTVTDADGTPCMGSFEIRDGYGRIYPAQPKRLAPDMFFQTQIYRETGETIHLPRGEYTVRCTHGPESIPEVKSLVIGNEPVKLDYRVARWIDTETLGYWSGDHHIHAAGCLHYESPSQGIMPADMLRHIMGEDVKVGCCLTWGPCFDFQKQFFTGRPDALSRYPYLLRYDIEVSGFGSHESGHLNLLRLTEQIPPGGDSKNHWPTLGLNTLRWAKRQGAVTGPADSGNGLTTIIGRTPGVDGPHRLPNYDLPAYDGIGANEFVMNITHQVPGPEGRDVPAVDFISTMDTDRVAEWNMWYHALNCGFAVVASGETDFPCLSGERVGLGRVYVQLEGRLDFDRWVEGLRDGRSYVSDGTGHLMNFRRHEDGSFQVEAAVRHEGAPSVNVELIVNGLPVATRPIKADGAVTALTFEAPALTRSSWVAVRVFPHVHSNPIRVLIHDQPVRASRHSAEWLMAGLEQCWKSKEKTYKGPERAEAEAAYDHARAVYREILAQSEQ